MLDADHSKSRHLKKQFNRLSKDYEARKHACAISARLLRSRQNQAHIASLPCRTQVSLLRVITPGHLEWNILLSILK